MSAQPEPAPARRAAAVRAAPLNRPIIIVAAPRSGSTLLFETLAVAHGLCTVGGEAHWLVEDHAELRPGAPGVESNRLEAQHATPKLADAMVATLLARDRSEGSYENTNWQIIILQPGL
jgi:hypothetical protein